MAKVAKKAVAKKAKKGPKLSTQEILDKYKDQGPTFFKVKLLGDRYYDHYLHRAGAVIVMEIDPALKAPNQIRILGEADPEDAEGDEDGEEETRDESQERGESEEEKI